MAYAARTLAELEPEQSRGIITLRGHQLMRALPGSYQTVPAVRDLQELLPGDATENMP